MDPQLVEERLASLYPASWYVPLSRLLTGPSSGAAWDAACPQMYVARYRDEIPYGAWCPEEGGMSILASQPLPWTTLFDTARAQGKDLLGGVVSAYGKQEHYAEHLADHLVAPAEGQDPRTVIRRLMRDTCHSTVTVPSDDGTVWAGVRTRETSPLDSHRGFGVLVRISADPEAEQLSALVRGLFAPALFSWFFWWRRATRQPYSGTVTALAKWTVPWPGQLELAGPAVDQAVRVRLHDITPVLIG
jgi:hypothetical protein